MRNFLTTGWGIKSFILSTLASIGFYAYDRFNNKPDLRVHIESIENIIDLKEDMAELQILYKNKPIIRNGQTVKVVQLKLENFGKSILNEHYESSRDFYFLLENSILLTTPAIESNEKYLASNIVCQNSAKGMNGILNIETEKPPSKICLTKVIFDSEKFVRFKFYVLQNISDNFSISLKGKISGVTEDEFPVIFPEPSKINEDAISFKGIVKFIKHFLIIYMASGVLGFVVIMISVHFEKKKRRIIMNHFLAKHRSENFSHSQFVNFYLENGLPKTLKILIDEIIVKEKKFVPIERFLSKDGNYFKIGAVTIILAKRLSISLLAELSFIEIKDGKIFFTQMFHDLISEFVKFGIDNNLDFKFDIERHIPPFT